MAVSSPSNLHFVRTTCFFRCLRSITNRSLLPLLATVSGFMIIRGSKHSSIAPKSRSSSIESCTNLVCFDLNDCFLNPLEVSRCEWESRNLFLIYLKCIDYIESIANKLYVSSDARQLIWTFRVFHSGNTTK